ncbi:MAG TPA: hypothetical protein PLB01_00355 [Thermoanaerobaculia bacterium]|nr:hypothetical protein [Thermoanaerobaculia bacterium]
MKRLCLLPVLLLIALGCATAAQKRRNAWAQARNTYVAAKAVYDGACRVKPHTRDDCADFYSELAASYDALEAAAPAVQAPAPIQMAAVEKAEKALEARVAK